MLSDEDSSKAIIDAMKQFQELAENSSFLPLSAACMREARSFVLSSFKSSDSDAYWSVSLTDQVSIVSTILIPLARRATARFTSASPEPRPYTRDMLVSLLSCTSRHWSDAITVPMQYAIDPEFHGDEYVINPGKYSEFLRKVDGLVFQFCASSPTELATAILSAVIDARLEPNIHMQILEEALHSYSL